MNSGVPDLQRLLAVLNETSSSKSQNQSWPQQTQAKQSSETSRSSAYDPRQNYTAPPPAPPHIHASIIDPHQGIGNNNIPFRKSPLPTESNSNTNTHTQHLQIPKQEQQNRSRSTTPNNSNPRPETATAIAIPDASQITTWPAALKHINKHIASNATTTGKIKHLISQQHKHEQEWWTQREAIVRRHASRAGNQDKATALLKSLGVLTPVSVPAQSSSLSTTRSDEEVAAADQQELRDFDRKVHRALQDMVRDYDAQLRRLGVPFFAIRHDLVLTGKDDEMVTTTTGTGGGKNSNVGKLDKGELRELQRRVVEHLEDLLID